MAGMAGNPLQGCDGLLDPIPRALPWASVDKPFGLEDAGLRRHSSLAPPAPEFQRMHNQAHFCIFQSDIAIALLFLCVTFAFAAGKQTRAGKDKS